MLAHQRQEWKHPVEEQQHTPAKTFRKQPQCDVRLRARVGLLVCGIAALAIVGAVCSEFVVTTGYSVVKTKSQIMALEKENEQLQLEIAQLKAPQRIQAVATRELGMVTPQNLYCVNPQTAPSAASVEAQDNLWDRVKANLKGATAQAGTNR